MFRMLRAEFYKMYKSRGFKVLCIVAILLGLLNVVMNNVINEEFLSKSLGTQVSEEQMESLINNDSDELLSITSDIEDINAVKNNDGNIIAETLDITRINNMADYLNSYSEQDKPLIAKMLRNGELKYACR